MYPQETRIFFAVLTAAIILAILMAFFVISIIRYHKKKVESHNKKIMTDTLLLEKERARIAADLHDDLGSTLSAIKIRLQCFDISTKNDELLISEIEGFIDDSMKKLKQISYNIMPMVLQRKGLQEALNELIETITIKNKIKIHFEYGLSKLKNEKEIHIFRIVQEIVSNILKHAKATSVVIRLKQVKRKILLQITDDGIGFNKNQALKNGVGLGLQNIMARVQLLKGTIYLATEKGVDYLIEIPQINE